MSPTPEALYQEGLRMLPAWNDKSPDRTARRAAAVERIARAAEAGHLEAMRSLAQGLGGAERARTLYEQAAELGNDAFSRDRLAERFGLSGYARGPDER